MNRVTASCRNGASRRNGFLSRLLVVCAALTGLSQARSQEAGEVKMTIGEDRLEFKHEGVVVPFAEATGWKEKGMEPSIATGWRLGQRTTECTFTFHVKVLATPVLAEDVGRRYLAGLRAKEQRELQANRSIPRNEEWSTWTAPGSDASEFEVRRIRETHAGNALRQRTMNERRRGWARVGNVVIGIEHFAFELSENDAEPGSRTALETIADRTRSETERQLWEADLQRAAVLARELQTAWDTAYANWLTARKNHDWSAIPAAELIESTWARLSEQGRKNLRSGALDTRRILGACPPGQNPRWWAMIDEWIAEPEPMNFPPQRLRGALAGAVPPRFPAAGNDFKNIGLLFDAALDHYFYACLRQRIAAGDPLSPALRQRLRMALYYPFTQRYSGKLDGESMATDWNEFLFHQIDRLYDLLDGGARSLGTAQRLVTKVEPAELKPDGQAQAVITARVAEVTADGTPAGSVAGEELRFELVPEPDGTQVGALSAATATTGVDGTASVRFTAPAAEALQDGRIVNAMIRVRSLKSGQTDESTIVFTPDQARVEVLPNYSGRPWSREGVVPADPRFPATIEVELSENEKPKPGARAVFVLASDARGELVGPDGKAGKSVEAVADARGVAQVLYRYRGKPVAGQPLREVIEIRSPLLAKPARAVVSVGIDLRLVRVLAPSASRGELNAGEEVPLEVMVADALHPSAKNLEPVLGWWGSGGPRGEVPLHLQLSVTPIGVVPKYLSEKVAGIKANRPLNEIVNARFVATRDGTVLWGGGAVAGLPRITPSFIGSNFFTVEATFATVAEAGGKRQVVVLPDGDDRNQRALLELRTGIEANAGKIFILEDPFGPHTRQARLLRWALEQADCGGVLELSDAIRLINEGDVRGLAEKALETAFGAVGGKLDDRVEATGSAKQKLLYAMLAAADSAWSANEDFRAAWSGAPGDNNGLIPLALTKAGLADLKLVAVEGGTLVDAATGQPLPLAAERIEDLAGRTGATLKVRDLGLYLVPAGLEVRPQGGQLTEFRSASR